LVVFWTKLKIINLYKNKCQAYLRIIKLINKLIKMVKNYRNWIHFKAHKYYNKSKTKVIKNKLDLPKGTPFQVRNFNSLIFICFFDKISSNCFTIFSFFLSSLDLDEVLEGLLASVFCSVILLSYTSYLFLVFSWPIVDSVKMFLWNFSLE